MTLAMGDSLFFDHDPVTAPYPQGGCEAACAGRSDAVNCASYLQRTLDGIRFYCRRCGHVRTYATQRGVLTAATLHYRVAHRTGLPLRVVMP